MTLDHLMQRVAVEPAARPSTQDQKTPQWVTSWA